MGISPPSPSHPRTGATWRKTEKGCGRVSNVFSHSAGRPMSQYRHNQRAMGTLRRLAWAALIVTDAGAFLPAPSTRVPLERTCDRSRRPGCSSTSTCRVVQPAAAVRGGPLCVEGQQRQHPRRHRLAGVLNAVKKGRNVGGRKQQERQQREDEESVGESGAEDAAAVEAMRLEKLAEWKAMMQSGEVGNPCSAR